MQRSKFPLVSIYGKLVIVSWTFACIVLLWNIYIYSQYFIEVFCGYFIDLESAFFLKNLFLDIGCANYNYLDNKLYMYDFRYFYQLNINISSLKNLTKILFLGSNLRLESPILNYKLRKSFLKNYTFKAYSIGISNNYLTYPVVNLGNSVISYLDFLEGVLFSSRFFLLTDFFNTFNLNEFYFNCNFIVGLSFLNRLDSNSILSSLFYFLKNFNLSINNLHIISDFMGRLSSFEIGLVSNINSSLKKRFIKNVMFVYFCGVDFDNLVLSYGVPSIYSFVVSQCSFLNVKVWKYSNIILPSSVYLESELHYSNIEGRYRYTYNVINKFFQSLTDIRILSGISIIKSITYSYNYSFVHNYVIVMPFFSSLILYLCNYNLIISSFKIQLLNNLNFKYLNKAFFMSIFNFKIFSFIFINTLFDRSIINYYRMDPYTLLSKSLQLYSVKVDRKIYTFNL